MVLKRTSHAVYEAQYHLVWTPKYRKDIFKELYLREAADETLRKVAVHYGWQIESMEVAEEHVHVLISFPPKNSISEVVRTLKSITAREMFRRYPSLRKRLWGGELWEDGYFARTVGDSVTKEIIRRYIESHDELELAPAQMTMFTK